MAGHVRDFNVQGLSPPRGQGSNSLITWLLFLVGLTRIPSHFIGINPQV